MSKEVRQYNKCPINTITALVSNYFLYVKVEVCLSWLCFERYFSHHRDDGRSISRNVANLNILVHDMINLLYYEYWTDKQKYLYGSVYTYNFSVYEGKQNSSSEYRILHGIFIKLMAPLLAPLLSSFYRQLVYCSSFSRIILVGRNELDWYHSFTQKIPTIRCEKEFS